jgi:hypothetical protein
VSKLSDVLKGKSKITEALTPDDEGEGHNAFEADEEITLEGDNVLIEEGDVPDLVPETQDCKCDHSTRSSGFCIHGNNI